MSFYALIVYFLSVTIIQSSAQDLDASASIFALDADNVEEPYYATLLDSDKLAEPQSASESIFDDTSAGSSTSVNQENLFSASPGSDDSTNFAFVYPILPSDSESAASDSLYSTQDIDSKVFFFSYSDQ